MRRSGARLAERAWRGESAAARVAGGLLAPAAWAFAAAGVVRGQLYDRGVLATHRVPARVVSVGNLAAGGTGKTPIVLWLAERLVACGRRVAIVARGYGRMGRDAVVVGSGGRPLVAPSQGGDEAVLLAGRFAGPVVVGVDRVAAAELACREFAAEIIVLDDGFQHRRLARDLDVVVVAGDPRRERLLPAGPLREGAGALGRAGAVIVTGADASWTGVVMPAGTPVFRGETVPVALVDATRSPWAALDPAALRGRAVAAVAGIARPERFVRQLEALGATVRTCRLLDDHHVFDAGDRAWIAAAGVEGAVVTTEKDLVKLAWPTGTAPVWALRIEARITPADALVRLAAGEDVLCGGPTIGEEVTT